MTAVAVEITTRAAAGAPAPLAVVTTEPPGPVILDDVETLTAGATPGCGEDNPYN